MDRSFIVAGAYYLVARFCLLLALETTNATTLWPPTGIALAAVLLAVVTTFHDITKRKQAEEALNRLNPELEQRVKQRTAELEEKNKELNRLNKMFVGRELRMVELKKKIKDLEERRS